MWLSALPHLPWYQLAVAPIPEVARRTMEALDLCTVVEVVVHETPPAVTTPLT